MGQRGSQLVKERVEMLKAVVEEVFERGQRL